MSASDSHPCLDKLAALTTELADLAYVLDRRGRADAADIASVIGARLAEVRHDLAEGTFRRDRRNEPVTSSIS